MKEKIVIYLRVGAAKQSISNKCVDFFVEPTQQTNKSSCLFKIPSILIKKILVLILKKSKV